MVCFRTLLVLLCLSACGASLPPVTAGSNIHTGRSFAFVRPAVQERGVDFTFIAAPAVETVAGRSKWTIRTSVARSDPNYPQITEVWSYGREQSYTKLDRRRMPCRSRCMREELGEIVLDRAAFETAAAHGFGFQMFGRRGDYEAYIPADAFQRVLAQVAGDG